MISISSIAGLLLLLGPSFIPDPRALSLSSAITAVLTHLVISGQLLVYGVLI